MPIENRVTIAIALGTAVTGVVALTVLAGTAQLVTASVLLGMTAVALVSLAFLKIGQSEEADRRRHPNG
jgi:hypothetical protein